MTGNDKQPPLILTPERKSTPRDRCFDCACQQFQTDDDITSAVEADARTETLIGWLSGAKEKHDGGKISLSLDKTKPCLNRLQASIVILNAIRDACRIYLESSSPPPISYSLPPSNNAKKSQPNVNEIATYEDSFPSLSSMSSTAAPTMLVGRKKSKGSKKNNSSSLSSKPSSSVAPTMLVGRKKSKGLKNNKQSSDNVGIHHAKKNNSCTVKKSQIGTHPKEDTGTKNHSSVGGIYVPKAKKKVKPVTISLSASSSSGRNFPSLSNPPKPSKIEGNISSLPSQDASEILGSTTIHIPINDGERRTTMISPALINGCSAENKASIQDKQKIGNGSTVGTISNPPKPLKIEGNIFSLPSQDTSGMLASEKGGIPHQNGVENNATITELFGPANRCSTDNKTGQNISSSNRRKLKRLALIYSTILRTHLAPFLLLELHLLVRLVSLSDKSHTSKTADGNTIRPFSEIFQFEQSCRDFAAETLSSLEPVIVNMGHETIKMFVTLPALQTYCPGLCMTLQDIIFAGNSALVFETDEKALGSNTNTPHLTLPFDHARDSRHNYRSVDLNRLFKEREELRDSFLYQLRAFQDVRGRLMEHAQAEQHIGSIRHQSREMLKNLSCGNNTLWFVNFFCDLLLQIGLVPVSETDSEVLKQIGDKKRLQKLHMRFTSKSGQTNKSSRKLRIDQKGPSPNTNTTLPEQSFPGHQEFFSIFLRSGDSYKFNVHLKFRLVQMITEMSAVNETKGLCEHIAKTQMLAKFLGMLVFSPNWNLSSVSATTNLTSGNMDINLPPINIKECIEGAWKQSRLVIVIPWVVQFLGMMKWDEVSRKLQYYIDAFALLWSINHICLPYQIEHHGYCRTNMIVISLQLDALFHDVVGLAPAQNLPILALPERKVGGSADITDVVPFDDLPLWLSKPFLFPSIPHLEDLFELLNNLAQNHGKMSITASAKKVRPNIVRNLGGIDSNQKFVSRIPFTGNNISPWASKRPRTPHKKGGIKEMLVDSFFHQHKDLQQLCEMIVDRAMKNFSESVSTSCINPIFRNGATSFEEYFTKSPMMILEEYVKMLKVLEADANRDATTMMNGDFDRIIKGTLPLLAPRETKPKVVEVACSLTINHASLKGKKTIHLIISEEKKKLVDEFVRKEKKVKAGVPLSNAKKGAVPQTGSVPSNDLELQSIIDLTASLRAFHDLDDSLRNRLERLKLEKARAIEYLHKHFIVTESSQPVVELELQMISMLKEFFSNPSPESILSLQAIIEAADVLSLLGTMGYAGSNKEVLETLVCNTTNMLALMDRVKYSVETDHRAEFISHDTLGNFLFLLVKGSLVNHRALETALLCSVKANQDAQAVSSVMLNRLASGRAGIDSTHGLVIMVRLQRLLMREQP